MHSYSIHQTKGCHRGEPYDVAAWWRAMSSRHGGHRSGRGGHRGFGPGGFGGPFAGGGDYGWGRKARRGDIRTAALLLLAEEPRNGYQIMQEVAERSEGVWRPSPGSVYPALAQLEDEGLIRSQESDGRKLYAITDEGRALLDKRPAKEPAPWEQISGGVSDEAFELRKIMRDLALAFVSVVRGGSDAQIAKAREALLATRRELYRILADDDGDGEDAAATVEDGD